MKVYNFSVTIYVKSCKDGLALAKKNVYSKSNHSVSFFFFHLLSTIRKTSTSSREALSYFVISFKHIS